MAKIKETVSYMKRLCPNSYFYSDSVSCPSLYRQGTKLRTEEDEDYDELYDGKTFTDQEAYKVTLASMRSLIAQAGNSDTSKSYSIPAGSEFDVSKDLSYFRRPDLTLAEVDQAIMSLQSSLNQAGDELKFDIENQLSELQAKKESMQKASDSSSPESDSSSSS